MESHSLGDRDAFGVKVGGAGAVVQVFQMRRGRVVDRTELVTEDAGRLVSNDTSLVKSPGVMFADADVLTAALQEFYARREPPAEIHVPTDLAAEDRDAFEGWLSERAGRRVRLHVPQRGEKRALLDLASRNAAMTYESLFNAETTASFDALDTLRGVLNLPALPRRIECFDISTLQGRETVGSMVVCVDGRMRRSEYRKFRIRGEASGSGPRPVVLDDFASMREVVLRRYRRLIELGEPFPDLILIDGGKGQLTAAYAALRDVGLERLIAVGIAKQEELLFTRDRVEGVALARENPALRLIQRVRNEAHRVAVTFHRRARRMRDLRSAIDEIPGVGPHRRKQLLMTFGSVAGVRRASREDLTAVVGAKTADAVIRYFGDRP
jgi:excinuclease ABC subunit C